MSTYYVSPTGNDSNSGSSGSPWQTLQSTQSRLSPGDTVMLYDGTYDQSSTSYGYWYIKTTSGTSSQPITWKAVNKWQATITAQGIGNPTVAAFNQQDYQIWDGIAFTTTSGSTALECNANHCILKNCYLHDVPGTTTGSAVTFGTGNTDNWAINCVIDHIGFSGGNQVQGIYMSSSYGGIWNCLCSRVAGWGIHLWHSACYCSVYNNVSFNNGNGGFMIANDGLTTGFAVGQGSVVANNIAYGNVGYGLRETGTTGINTYTNNLFWNNTLGNYGQITGGTVPVYTFNANPQFVNYTGDATGDYHLQSTSPCIGIGIPGGPTYDYDNNTRPQMAGYDIGPYEYGSSVYVLMPVI